MDDREKLVLKVLREVLDLVSPERERFSMGLAIALNNVVSMMIRRERDEEAVAPLEESLSMAIEFGGERGRSAIWPRVNLAETYAAVGRTDEAVALADAILEIAEKDYGTDSIFVGLAHRAQAKVNLAQGNVSGAREHTEAAARIFTALGKGGEQFMKGIERLRVEVTAR